MPKIDLKLRSYEELKLETYKLITDRYLLQLANDKLQQKIDKAIEYIKEHTNNGMFELRSDTGELNYLLRILEDKNIEFDVLKALNTDLKDDVEMG